MSIDGSAEVRVAESVEEATATLAGLEGRGAALAGGTWIMRAPGRGRSLASVHVSLHRIAELRGVDEDGEARLGALATHLDLARLRSPAAAGIARAAALAAFPAVRSVATVGGNLCTNAFWESDLVPALLAGDATVELATSRGRTHVSLAEFLARGRLREPGEVACALRVPLAAGRRSGFERLTIRGGGEYAVANAAVSVELDAGSVRRAWIAVGSVEPVARLCPDAAAALKGQPLDGDAVAEAARIAARECTGRDGHDAPGWYREAVVPHLVARALESCNDHGADAR